ncbi:hypothetical protein ACWEKT_29300 [Nocardia takedensis]
MNTEEPETATTVTAGHRSAPVDGLERVVLDYIRMNAAIVDRNGYADPDWVYRSAYHLLLDQGRFFTPAVRPRGIVKMIDRLCYRNAVATAREHDGLVYAEGFGCSSWAAGIPIAHAWCVEPDGTVIDPTWEHSAQVYYGLAVTDPALWPDDGEGLLSDPRRCELLLREGLSVDTRGPAGRRAS